MVSNALSLPAAVQRGLFSNAVVAMLLVLSGSNGFVQRRLDCTGS